MYEDYQTLSLIPAFWLAGTLLVATFTDVTTHRIPNTLLAPALSVAVLASAAIGGYEGLFMTLSGLGVGLAMMLPLYAIGAMGAGDVKLLGVAGAFLGPHGALIAGVMTFIAGAVFGLLWLAWRVARPGFNYLYAALTKTHNRAVFVAAANDSRHNRFAYAPAIAAGALFAVWHQGWTTLINLG